MSPGCHCIHSTLLFLQLVDKTHIFLSPSPVLAAADSAVVGIKKDCRLSQARHSGTQVWTDEQSRQHTFVVHIPQRLGMNRCQHSANDVYAEAPDA